MRDAIKPNLMQTLGETGRVCGGGVLCLELGLCPVYLRYVLRDECYPGACIYMLF